MAENPDSPSDFPLRELREITLLLPGEHFFCETLSVPADLAPEDFIDFACRLWTWIPSLPFPPINWLGVFTLVRKPAKS